ncbi:hypothetical protein BDZ97DRAFT_1921873 [Flammula alnicola]|nr:hypothetical protein BDZ97DRAFT_1921873 [Flammula alnicola]
MMMALQALRHATRRVPLFNAAEQRLSSHLLKRCAGSKDFLLGSKEAKYFSTATDLPRPRRPGRPRTKRVILTLKPEQMSEVGQNICDVSKHSLASFRLDKSATSDEFDLPIFLWYAHGTPFPPNTKGVLYYHQPPSEPGVSGQVRFRLCDDITEFSRGHDLQSKEGTPWNIPLSTIIRGRASWQGLRVLLADEGIFDPTSVATASLGEAFKSRSVMTLRPEKMVEKGQEICSLSGIHNARLRAVNVQGTPHMHVVYRHGYVAEHGLRAFPPNTRGVFYYHIQPGEPPISGQIRFRICNDLAGFADGHDLLDSDGETWNVPLYYIATYEVLAGFESQLLYDSLVDKELLDDIKKLPQIGTIHPRRYLYSPTQPFVIDLQKQTKKRKFNLITRHSRDPFDAHTLFCQRRDRELGYVSPYAGRIRARFEVSTLPEHVKDGPSLVLRILEILEPVECVVKDYDYFIAPPKAGELFSKKARNGSYRPWHLALKKRTEGKAFLSFLEHYKP